MREGGSDLTLAGLGICLSLPCPGRGGGAHQKTAGFPLSKSSLNAARLRLEKHEEETYV